MNMSTYRKKSTTSTEDGSSSSSSGSSSSETETSESSDESSSTDSSSGAGENNSKAIDNNNAKSQVNTRRKSSEFKTGTKTTETDKHNVVPSNAKSRAVNSSNLRQQQQQQQQRQNTTISSEDDVIPAVKKPVRSGNNATGAQKRKNSNSSNIGQAQKVQSVKAPQIAAIPKASLQTQNVKSAQSKLNSNMKQQSEKCEDSTRKNSSTLLTTGTDDSDKDVQYMSNNKSERRGAVKSHTTEQSNSTNVDRLKNAVKVKQQTKRNVSTKAVPRPKSSEESESESGSDSANESSSSSGSEASDSANSFASQPTKAVKGKRAPTNNRVTRFDSDEQNAETPHKVNQRKLTRSLSTRRKQQTKNNTVGGTDSDSDIMPELDANDKRSLSKSPAKKLATNKCKVKKESNNGTMQPHPRCLTPPQQIEKKCPIEGCDSSGHLSGNLDKHFLPEACPIYHNMSASECKERANERKLRFEAQQDSHSSSFNSSNSKIVTPEQKEFLNKIRESRARFRPISHTINADKVKLEKDCTDEDREPSLAGLVPDYDLQLFREAQAIASEKIEEELKDLPVGKGIKYITMGKYKMKVWYQSPYPEDAARLPQMYICEFCLRYQTNETGIKRHAQKCVWRHPPGDEIYRKGKLQVWQVDGKRHKQYCQHLCLLAKFFLDHKTLYYDVEPFLFYIMTLADVSGCHTVGYFSKEKNSFYNVSCILTLPPYQRKGYGRLLIDFSYLLTRVEGKIGSPEKPLSDLGLISYRSYWKDVLLDFLCNRTGNTLSIKDVSQEMAIYSYDIVSTLQALGMMKYWKGKHIVLKKQDVLDEYEERVKRRGNFPKIDDSCLRWSPFVSTQSNNVP